MPKFRRLRTRNRTILIRDRKDSIKLTVDNKELDIVCSKTQLKANSEFFNVMLSRYYKEEDGVISLKEIDENVMLELLKLVHKRSVPEDCDILSETIILSDMFLFDSLKNQLTCEAYQRLSEDNCLLMWMELKILPHLPLVWKAKSLSLTTFAHQRNMGTINNLELSELLTYLGHPNLQCGSEMNVFRCILEWIEKNRKNELQCALKETLGCINYKDISLSQLFRIIKHPYISKYNNIVNILQYIKRLKNGEEIRTSNKNIRIAQAWYSSKERYSPEYLFVFNDDFGHDFFYHGHRVDNFLRKIATVSSKSIDGLTGGEVQAYKMKVYIFGGEYSMGKGSWNKKFWEFNLETNQLIDTEYGIPRRRNFKSCIVEDNLFIIGGTGPLRYKLNDMLWFNFTTKEWDEHAIKLPCCATSFKYCNFNGQLFILDCPNKHGYIFRLNRTWMSVKIAKAVKELMDDCSSLSIFAYRQSLFFKGRKLLEVKLVYDMLILKKAYDIPPYPRDILIETAIHHNRVYSMYTDQPFGDMKLEYLDLDNLESFFFEKVGLHFPENDGQLVDAYEELYENFTIHLRYNPNKMMKMFFFNSYKYSGYEDLFVGNV